MRTPPSPPAGNITIVLQSYGVQIDFKNVRLNLSSPGNFPEVPEGGAIWVFSLPRN